MSHKGSTKLIERKVYVMKVIRVLKLGTECKDRATGLIGTVTHWMYDMGGGIEYLFQPRGLDKMGQPLKRIYVCSARLSVKDSDYENVPVPVEILGSVVTDKASGFTGMAVHFIRHINGCFHVLIQPEGTLAGENTPIMAVEFDLRGCSGPMIKEMSETQKTESKEKTPSPTGGNPQKVVLSDHLTRR